MDRKKRLWQESEFQSAMVRLAVWLFGAIYMALSAVTGSYPVDLAVASLLFALYLAVFIAVFLSVLRRPVWVARRYFTLVTDVTGVSLAIFLTRDATSPYFILYFWLFISYGTRYGKNLLFTASLLSVAAFCLVSVLLGGWAEKGYEISFAVLSLLFLPLYQYGLLRKLHEAKTAAEASAKAKSLFLSNMSHEIRTPLNGLLGMAQLLMRCDLGREEKALARNLLESGQSLNVILNEILDYSKIESGSFNAQRENFSPRALLQEVADLMLPTATNKGLALSYEIDASLPDRLFGDVGCLKQVLLNLVDNAIKFTEEGSVHISARGESLATLDWCLRIVVRDSGIGMQKGDVDKVFERFAQVDSSFKRFHRGAGLGLAISKRIVESMGGRIGVASAVGKGSEFWFEVTLPEGKQETASIAPPDERESTATDLDILLVEDDPVSRLAEQRLLEQAGYRVSAAENGAQALTMIGERAFDLVLMDVHMPEMDGLEATRRIRGELVGAQAEVPILGVTASVLSDELQRFLAAGMDGVIPKPFVIEDLSRLIAETIAHKMGERGSARQTGRPPVSGAGRVAT